jgi:hypothetical protein
VTARVRLEWARRVEAEYRSAALTQHLTLWLIQMGASPDLIRDGLRITDDELRHAELSHQVVLAAGGTVPVLDRERLGLRRTHESLEDDVLDTCVATFCLGETVAVPLFRALREQCQVPVARAALDQVLLDEVRHRDFGWALLGWLLEGPAGEQRRLRVEHGLPAELSTLAAHYGLDEGDEPALSDDERGWGLMPAADYREIVARTTERDYRPRFAALGITLA